MMVATLGIALPEIRGTFSLSEVAAGSLFSVMMMIAAVMSGVGGRLADVVGRKKVLITGLSLLAGGFALASLSHDVLLFFCCLAITGVGYGFTPPSLYAIMSDLLPERRGLGASLISVTYGVGGAIGGVLIGWLAWRITRALLHMATDATPTSGDFVGKSGKVVTPLRAHGLGEVLVHLGGQPVKLSARSDADLAVGEPVVVVEVISPTSVIVEAAATFWSTQEGLDR